MSDKAMEAACQASRAYGWPDQLAVSVVSAYLDALVRDLPEHAVEAAGTTLRRGGDD